MRRIPIEMYVENMDRHPVQVSVKTIRCSCILCRIYNWKITLSSGIVYHQIREVLICGRVVNYGKWIAGFVGCKIGPKMFDIRNSRTLTGEKSLFWFLSPWMFFHFMKVIFALRADVATDHKWGTFGFLLEVIKPMTKIGAYKGVIQFA